ncbi:UNKNOWN [Stylonychia lemnae]|uniref:Uncharacterized protein n=1 Tax=Stylonychia lemnae TaxID=5949 RepID=A0A078A1F2_STYLE|nr:UNKNOWN [Stylonychia lemnae]|eukprot:CDW75925.1 UNKNOWN [Stylonychia lemnae]
MLKRESKHNLDTQEYYSSNNGQEYSIQIPNAYNQISEPIIYHSQDQIQLNRPNFLPKLLKNPELVNRQESNPLSQTAFAKYTIQGQLTHLSNLETQKFKSQHNNSTQDTQYYDRDHEAEQERRKKEILYQSNTIPAQQKQNNHTVLNEQTKLPLIPIKHINTQQLPPSIDHIKANTPQYNHFYNIFNEENSKMRPPRSNQIIRRTIMNEFPHAQSHQQFRPSNYLDYSNNQQEYMRSPEFQNKQPPKSRLIANSSNFTLHNPQQDYNLEEDNIRQEIVIRIPMRLKQNGELDENIKLKLDNIRQILSSSQEQSKYEQDNNKILLKIPDSIQNQSSLNYSRVSSQYPEFQRFDNHRSSLEKNNKNSGTQQPAIELQPHQRNILNMIKQKKMSQNPYKQWDNQGSNMSIGDNSRLLNQRLVSTTQIDKYDDHHHTAVKYQEYREQLKMQPKQTLLIYEFQQSEQPVYYQQMQQMHEQQQQQNNSQYQDKQNQQQQQQQYLQNQISNQQQKSLSNVNNKITASNQRLKYTQNDINSQELNQSLQEEQKEQVNYYNPRKIVKRIDEDDTFQEKVEQIKKNNLKLIDVKSKDSSKGLERKSTINSELRIPIKKKTTAESGSPSSQSFQKEGSSSNKNIEPKRRQTMIGGSGEKTSAIHQSIASYALNVFKKIQSKKQNLKIPQRPDDLKQIFLNISLDAYKKVLQTKQKKQEENKEKDKGKKN